MATKTFEELKQLAIQIRDEKTNKQNTATRVGTAMLEHINKLEQDYYDKTTTDEELKERDDKLTGLGEKIKESDKWTRNFFVITRPQNVIIDFLENNKIRVSLKGSIASVDIKGISITFGEKGDTFDIEQYYSLFYNLDTSEIEVDASNGNDNTNRILLLHNEGGKIGGGILATYGLQKQIERVNYHVASGGSLDIIKYNGPAYVKFSNINIFDDFNNGYSMSTNEEYIEVGNYKTLVYDYQNSEVKVVSFGGDYAKKNYMILLHNEPGGISGLFAEYFLYSKMNLEADGKKYDFPNIGYIDKTDGSIKEGDSHNHTDKFTLYAGTMVKLVAGCGPDAFAIAVYDKEDENLIFDLSKSGVGVSDASHEYTFYAPKDYNVILTCKTGYYQILKRVSAYEKASKFSDIDYARMANSLYSPLSRITESYYSGKTLFVTLNNSGFNGFYPPNNVSKGIPAFSESKTFKIPLYETLAYIIETGTVEVTDISDKRNMVILAHNEGYVSYGAFAHYINQKLSEGIKSRIYDLENKLYKEGTKLVDYVKQENNLYRPDGTPVSDDTWTSSWYNVVVGKYYIVKVTSTYSQSDWLMAAKVKNGEFRESLIASPQNSSNSYSVVVLADGTFDQIFVSGCSIYEAEFNSESSKWIGKKMLCIGDSITDQGYLVNSLSSLLGTIAYNRGASGTTVADSSVAGSFCQRFDKPTDDTLNAKGSGFPSEADLIIVFGGINDWGRIRDQVLGSNTAEIDRTTFYGAWHYLLRGLKSRYRNAQIYVLNLHHTYDEGSFKNWSDIEYIDTEDRTKGFTFVKNKFGSTKEDYRTAISEVSKFYGIEVIDLARCGFSFLQIDDWTDYSAGDGLHPNETGAKIMAEYIASKIN